MKKCVFCSVVKQNEPYHEVIYSDKKHLAFLDMYPSRHGHILVIPKKHTDFVLNLSEKEYLSLFKLSRKLAKHLKKIVKSKYIYIFVKGARVKHVHIHLIPTNKNRLGHLPRIKKITKKRLIKIGKTLRKSLKFRDKIN
ncbi:HIT family protein [Candidatus Nomurabacteria bacterium]|nr:HIT family protein [Candidatus Nomurabacteria bacterium]